MPTSYQNPFYQRHLDLKIILLAIILLSLIPASLLVARRVRAETGANTVALLMDEHALQEQADFLGTSSLELALRYQKAGLQGIILYEDTLETLATRGAIDLVYARELRAEDTNLAIPSNSILVRERQANALDMALAKLEPTPETVLMDGEAWYVFQGVDSESLERPAGIATEIIQQWQDAGFDIAYRPINYPNVQNVGADFPAVPYIIHEGTEVAGNPDSLDTLIATSQDYFTGLIEGVEQDGMERIVNKVPLARTFSINQDWLNTLEPEVVGDKFALATRERGAKLLYVRPYTTEKFADMVTQTEKLVADIKAKIELDGFRVGTVQRISYQSTPLLRWLSTVGVLAGLLLLMLMYPVAWGIAVTLAVLGLGVLAGGISWDALALAAALSFPVLGYGLLPQRWYTLILATLGSLVGAMLLIAVGSDQAAMLAAEPFAGVGATLVIPPLLFLFHWLLKYRRPVDWVHSLWDYKIRLGDVAIVFIGLIALALVFMRRGNFPIIGASSGELALRDVLGEYFARPRFKELLGHPLAVLALTNTKWAEWIQGTLLTAGIVAQATILNSFSHYHTPVMISLERTIAALVIGGLVGLLLIPLNRFAVYVVKRWLQTVQTNA